jgi:hypothetical protein
LAGALDEVVAATPGAVPDRPAAEHPASGRTSTAASAVTVQAREPRPMRRLLLADVPPGPCYTIAGEPVPRHARRVRWRLAPVGTIVAHGPLRPRRALH